MATILEILERIRIYSDTPQERQGRETLFAELIKVLIAEGKSALTLKDEVPLCKYERWYRDFFLQPQDIKNLFRVVERVPQIKCLGLNRYVIDREEIAQAIAKGIEKNKTLESLDFISIDINYSCMIIILEALKKNTTIKKVNFGDDLIIRASHASDQELNAIAGFVRSSRCKIGYLDIMNVESTAALERMLRNVFKPEAGFTLEKPKEMIQFSNNPCPRAVQTQSCQNPELEVVPVSTDLEGHPSLYRLK